MSIAGERRVLVGREVPADLVVGSPLVSRRHALVTFTAGNAVVQDLGSANGTFVNGRRIDRAILSNGDSIHFADRMYVFNDGVLEAATPDVVEEVHRGRSSVWRRPLAWISAGSGAVAVALMIVLIATGVVGGAGREGAGVDMYARPAEVADFVAQVQKSVVTVYCDTGEALSTGSGFAMSTDSTAESTSTVVTNEHVVADCANGRGRISATGAGFTSDAAIISADRENDLASIRIDRVLPSLQRATRPSVGMWVAAFGSPHGIAGTVTFGTASNVLADEHLVMTDAAINHGNSGGPLVNARGEVVGLNTFKLDETSTVGFAVSWPALCIGVVVCDGAERW